MAVVGGAMSGAPHVANDVMNRINPSRELGQQLLSDVDSYTSAPSEINAEARWRLAPTQATSGDDASAVPADKPTMSGDTAQDINAADTGATAQNGLNAGDISGAPEAPSTASAPEAPAPAESPLMQELRKAKATSEAKRAASGTKEPAAQQPAANDDTTAAAAAEPAAQQPAANDDDAAAAAAAEQPPESPIIQELRRAKAASKARTAEPAPEPVAEEPAKTPAAEQAAPTTKSESPLLQELRKAKAMADAKLSPSAEPAAPVDSAAHEAATSPLNDRPEPTPAQIDANNYRLGHLRISGLDISIENPEGSTRSGTAPNGTEWSTTMQHHYGYIRGTTGKDGDHVDVFVKPGTPEDFNGPVFVVDQTKPGNGHFDEHKALVGFASADEARQAYHANYEKGWTGGKTISETTVDGFKDWLANGDTTKPFADRAQELATTPASESPTSSQVEQKTGAPAAAAKGKWAPLSSPDKVLSYLSEAAKKPKPKPEDKPVRTEKDKSVAPAEDVITQDSGRPFRSNSEASAELYNRHLKDTHEVVQAEGGEGFVVAKKAIRKPQESDKTQIGDETDRSEPVYSREEDSPLPESKRISAAELAQVVEERLAKFGHQPPVVIRDSVRDVLGDRAANDGHVASGMVHDGKIHLFREGIGDSAAATRTLWHELLHYGLRRFMTKEQYIPAMQKLYDADPEIRKVADKWLATEDADKAKRDGMAYARARGVDEALADLAEKNEGDYEKNGPLAKTIRAVSDWIANVADRFGFKEAAQRWRGVSQTEAHGLIKSIFGKLRDDAPATSGDVGFTSDPTFSRAGAKGEDKAALDKWFGNSKVVDADGKPQVVYHATTADVSKFDRGAESIFDYGDGKDSGGIFFSTDPKAADYYARGSQGYEKGANIIPAYIRLENPARIADGLPLKEQARLLREAESAGHDGAMIGDHEFAVFDPSQAKSIFNGGDYSRDDAGLLMSRGTSEPGMSKKAIHRVLDPIAAMFPRLEGKWHVVDDSNELPADAVPSDIEGGYSTADGHVWIVGRNIDNPTRLREVFAHEAVGHMAIEEMLHQVDPKLWGNLVRQVNILEKGGNPLIKHLAAEVDKSQPGLDKETRVKEILAKIAEDDIQNNPKFVGEARNVFQRFLDGIKSFMKLAFGLDMGHRDVLNIVKLAERYLGEKGEGSEVVGGMKSVLSSRKNSEFSQQLATAWLKVADHPQSWRYGYSKSTDPRTVAKEMSSPDVQMEGRETPSGGAEFLSRNGKVEVIKHPHAENEYIITAPLAGSEGIEKGGGSALYQAAAAWIRNKGGVWVPEHGLTPINEFRTTSNMLSAALRFMDTSFMEPDPKQGVPWKRGDTMSNIAALATREAEYVEKHFPFVKDLEYDTQKGTVENKDASIPTTTSSIRNLLSGLDPKFSKGVGDGTVARAVFTRTALSRAAAEPGISGAALFRDHGGRPDALSLKNALYSRKGETDARGDLEEPPKRPTLDTKGLPANLQELHDLKQQEQKAAFMDGKIVYMHSGPSPIEAVKWMRDGYSPYVGVVAQKMPKGSLRDDLARIFTPGSRADEGIQTAGIIRGNLGEQARERELAMERVKDIAAMFDKMPVSDCYKFIDQMERGVPIPGQKLSDASVALRKLLDDRRDQVLALGKGQLENFNANYFPHIWRETAKAADFFSRRGLQGSKSFLKQRKYDYFSEGLAAGLEPITTNPVELVMLKAREMDRYIYAQKIFAEMKAKGLARFVRFGDDPPEGWKKINDPIARVYGNPEIEIPKWKQNPDLGVEADPNNDLGGQTVRAPGAVVMGEYYAPEQAATIINNHLSPGLSGNSAFDMWRRAGNAMNSAQLGLSAFHVGFTTLDAMLSKQSLGIHQISRGDIVKGIGSVIQAYNPAQPLMNLYKGDKLLKAYLGRIDDPDMAPIVDALQQAGGRVKMDDFYRVAGVNEFKQALRAGRNFEAARKFLPWVMDKINWPVFEALVPRQKLGVFFDMAKYELEKNPDMGLEEKRRVMGKLWDSVDNRMGQMVYDNVFWNRMLKDALMATVRSVGWNLGTFRELGGGVLDVKDIIKDKQLSHRTSYVISMVMGTAMLGAAIGYLYGQVPKELKDYFFPRTGRIRPDGSPDRLSLPSYMKDVYEYGHDIRGFVKYGEDPTHTLKNKMHPLISTISQMLNNEDFYGGNIRSPGDPAVQQIKDEAEFLLKQVLPFGVRNYQQQAKLKEEEPTIEGYLTNPSMYGLTPAPGYITKTDAMIESGEVWKNKDGLIRKFEEELKDKGPQDGDMKRWKNAGLDRHDIRRITRSAHVHKAGRLRAFGGGEKGEASAAE